MSGKQSAAFVFGVVVGATVAYAVLPGGRERLRALRARAARIHSLDQAVSEVERFGRAVLAKVEERYDAAMLEARESRQATQQDLWRRFEIAKREGHLPPPAA